MNNAIWNVWPHVIVDRVPEEYDPEDTKLQEHFINWAVESDIPRFFLTTHGWFRNMLIDGVSTVKTRYVTRWRRTCEVHRIKTHLRQGEQGFSGGAVQQPQREKTAAEVLDELFGRQQWVPVEEPADNEVIVNIIEDRRPIENVRVVFRGPSEFIDEADVLVYRPILVEDNPHVDVIEPEHLVVPHRTRDLQTAKRVTHVHFMTVEEIRHEASDQRFDPWTVDEEDWATLEAISKGKPDKESRDARGALNRLSEHKDMVEGIHDNVTTQDKNSVPIWEIYKRADVDGDGELEEVVIQVSPHLQQVLHVTYLDTLNPHGRRPFASIHFQAPTDRFYMPGLAAHLAPINIQANITVNQVNDRQTLVSNPIYFYRPMALPQDPDQVRELEPGQGIETPDPGGINFPSWGTAPLADMQIMDISLAFADRIGTSPQLGGSNQSQNAPRTARGTLALISEGNLKVDVLIALAQKEGFAELFQQLFGLYATFMPDEKYFYATGGDRKKKPEMMARRLMRGKYEFKFRGNTVNTNPEVQRTLAQIRYQVASTNPLYAQDPVKFRELLRDFLDAHSDGTQSTDRILPDLPGEGAGSHPPMSQMEEITAMRFHRMIEPLPTDNHLKHMTIINKFVASPAFEQLDEVAVALIAQHHQGHQQALQRQQQIAALQAAPGSAGDGGGGGEQSVGLSEFGGGVQ
jgi:hypothetical protein